MSVNHTHDAALRSWVPSANTPGHDFPIQNLPFCLFRRKGSHEQPRGGVAIGDAVFDLAAAHATRIFDGKAVEAAHACSLPTLNTFLALGRAHASALRDQLSLFLRETDASRPRDPRVAELLLAPASEVELFVPATIGDYTDFYASIHHATNVGRMFRPDAPLLPNYKWIPIGYHGRASSVLVSDQPIRRPFGQMKAPDAKQPVFGPCRMLDYEVEIGAFVGVGNALGTPITLDEAERHILGLCLLNDWSARDVQSWEYQPLGPFLAKSFATTVSPWIVTLDALEPFRAPLAARAADDPQPLPYLDSPANRARGAFDITVDVRVRTARMREAGVDAVRVSRARATELYWTLAQMVTHHTSNGCNLRPGDLIASGTVSNEPDGTWGSLLELTLRGQRPLTLSSGETGSGETRGFLEDGDEVILSGFCEREGHARIGFGDCRGIVQPAVPPAA